MVDLKSLPEEERALAESAMVPRIYQEHLFSALTQRKEEGRP